MRVRIGEDGELSIDGLEDTPSAPTAPPRTKEDIARLSSLFHTKDRNFTRIRANRVSWGRKTEDTDSESDAASEDDSNVDTDEDDNSPGEAEEQGAHATAANYSQAEVRNIYSYPFQSWLWPTKYFQVEHRGSNRFEIYL